MSDRFYAEQEEYLANTNSKSLEPRQPRRILIKPTPKPPVTTPPVETKAEAKYHLTGKFKKPSRKKASKRSKRRSSRCHDFYSTTQWHRARYAIIAAFGRSCMACGDTAKINVDHILPRSVYDHLKLNLTNLQVLCWPCNEGKGTRDRKDYRTSEQKLVAEELQKNIYNILKNK